MNRIILFTVLLFATQFTFAQNQVLVSNGPGYNQQSFYNLSDDQITTIDNESWDIAFTTIGLQDAGIHINESANFDRGATGVELEVYVAPTTDWEEGIEVGNLTDRLYNDETSWTYGGAFNQGRDLTDPFDFGWGSYNPTVRMVTGDRIFAVKLRDGTWKKIQFQGITLTTYNFRYANMDNTDEVVQALDKTDFEDGTLALFSFETGEVVATPQDKWDLTFTRYATPLTQGGIFANYVVTGVLSRDGIQVARANDIDPATVEYQVYQDSLTENLDAIGFDWKTFAGAWSLDENRAYFVIDSEGDIWKINFVSFGGSGNGNSVFEKSRVNLASTNGAIDAINTFAISPNPAQDQTQIVFDWNKNATNLNGQLYNLAGQVVRSYNIQANSGLNAYTLNNLPTESGIYILKVSDNNQSLVSKLVIE